MRASDLGSVEMLEKAVTLLGMFTVPAGKGKLEKIKKKVITQYKPPSNDFIL